MHGTHVQPRAFGQVKPASYIVVEVLVMYARPVVACMAAGSKHIHCRAAWCLVAITDPQGALTALQGRCV